MKQGVAQSLKWIFTNFDDWAKMFCCQQKHDFLYEESRYQVFTGK